MQTQRCISLRDGIPSKGLSGCYLVSDIYIGEQDNLLAIEAHGALLCAGGLGGAFHASAASPVYDAIHESDRNIVHDWNGVWACVCEIWIRCISIRKVRLRICGVIPAVVSLTEQN